MEIIQKGINNYLVREDELEKQVKKAKALLENLQDILEVSSFLKLIGISSAFTGDDKINELDNDIKFWKEVEFNDSRKLHVLRAIKDRCQNELMKCGIDTTDNDEHEVVLLYFLLEDANKSFRETTYRPFEYKKYEKIILDSYDSEHLCEAYGLQQPDGVKIPRNAQILRELEECARICRVSWERDYLIALRDGMQSMRYKSDIKWLKKHEKKNSIFEAWKRDTESVDEHYSDHWFCKAYREVMSEDEEKELNNVIKKVNSFF